MKKIIITYWGFKARTLQATQQHAMRMCDRWTDGQTYRQTDILYICTIIINETPLKYAFNSHTSAIVYTRVSISKTFQFIYCIRIGGNVAIKPPSHASTGATWMNILKKRRHKSYVYVCMYVQNGRKTDRLIDSWMDGQIRLYVRHVYLWLSQCSFVVVVDGMDWLGTVAGPYNHLIHQHNSVQ